MCFDVFVDVSCGWYVNFVVIGDFNFGEFELILMWWIEIVELILW